MINLVVASHSQLLLAALEQERSRYEVSVVGSDGDLVVSDILWLHSSWLRSLLEQSRSSLAETTLTLADFTGEEIRAALDLLRAEESPALVFSRRTKTVLETLGVNLSKATLRPVVKVEETQKIKVEYGEEEVEEAARNLQEIQEKLMLDNDLETNNEEEANSEEIQQIQSVESQPDQTEDDGRQTQIQLAQAVPRVPHPTELQWNAAVDSDLVVEGLPDSQVSCMQVYHHCEKCDYKSTKMFNVKKHTAAIHDGVRYPCDLCDYKATETGHLKKHKRTRHASKQ